MIDSRYGAIAEEQLEKYKKKLHSTIHWLLIYAERKDDALITPYFLKVQKTFMALNETLNYPEQVLEIVNIVEMAKQEYFSGKYKHETFRGYILDAHALIDKI